MKQPSHLTPAGRAAWRRMIGALEERGQLLGEFEDAAVRYVSCVDTVLRLRSEWVAEGCPVTALGGSTGAVTVIHPLLRTIREEEAQAARLSTALGLDPSSAKKRGKAIGKPAGASSADDRKPRLTVAGG